MKSFLFNINTDCASPSTNKISLFNINKDVVPFLAWIFYSFISTEVLISEAKLKFKVCIFTQYSNIALSDTQAALIYTVSIPSLLAVRFWRQT